MKNALGLVEIQGLATAIEVADAMVKAANIHIIETENTRGLGYITVKVEGDVGAVTAAVNVGKQTGIQFGKLVSAKVIPRPSDSMAAVFCEPKQEPAKAEAKPKAEPKAKAEPKPEPVKVEAKAETKPEPVKAEPVKAEPKAKPEPVKPEPKVEIKLDTPGPVKVEEPKPEEPKIEEPKSEEPKPEESKTEEEKPQEPPKPAPKRTNTRKKK